MNHCVFGDCRDSMRQMIADGVKVQMCVTSPPYYGLRDYGTGTWSGGNADCDHKRTLGGNGTASAKQVTSGCTQTYSYPSECHLCGATRTDNQLGLEPSVGAYVSTMVDVFRLVRELLTDDGTLWLNIGDSYAGSGKGGNPVDGKQATNKGSQTIGVLYGTGNTAREAAGTNVTRHVSDKGIKPKDLCGIPWRLAFALQEDGWWLRQDIIWSKPNPMPESVTDRCTKSHEYIFLLSKQPTYYFDAAAISEEALGEARGGGHKAAGSGHTNLSKCGKIAYARRNKRSVWTIQTEPYQGAHFAAFPTELISPCILAGSRIDDVVFDPFFGSGTTGQVAQKLGRRWLGCELNEAYGALQYRRTAQDPLFSSP